MSAQNQSSDLPAPSLAAARLINDLDRIEDRFVLALDDYHEVTDLGIHEMMDFVSCRGVMNPMLELPEYRTLVQ